MISTTLTRTVIKNSTTQRDVTPYSGRSGPRTVAVAPTIDAGITAQEHLRWGEAAEPDRRELDVFVTPTRGIILRAQLRSARPSLLGYLTRRWLLRRPRSAERSA